MSASRSFLDALQAADQAVIWFAVLQRGRRCQDSGLTERATQELECLGVRVAFSRVALPETRVAEESPGQREVRPKRTRRNTRPYDR